MPDQRRARRQQEQAPPTLSFEAGVLVLLDQRRLPGEVVVLRCTTAAEVAAAIRDMAVRGAPAIGVAGAYGVAMAAREAAAGQRGARQVGARAAAAARLLGGSRPTAVNLDAAVRRVLAAIEGSAADGPAAMARAAEAEAAAIEEFERQASATMGRLGADILPAGDLTLLVHCNTGRLATPGRGTALAVVREAWDRGRLSEVLVDETRPRLQGARLTALELGWARIPHTLIVDALAPALMRAGRVDAVLVGADRIAQNGDVANKVGTYGLALAAHHHGVPMLVVAPTSTIDAHCETGDDIAVERRDADEVLRVGDEQLAPVGTGALNLAFDVTPAALVTAIVTERGVAAPPAPETVGRLWHDPAP